MALSIFVIFLLWPSAPFRDFALYGAEPGGMPRAGLNIDNLKEGQEVSPDYLQGLFPGAGQALLTNI